MANSSAAAGETLSERRADDSRSAAPQGYVDAGQPVDDLPPLEEFGFDEPAVEPPAKPAASVANAPEERPAGPEPAPLIEPVKPPASPAATTVDRPAVEEPAGSAVAVPDVAPRRGFLARLGNADTAPAVEPAHRRERSGGWRAKALALLPASRRQRVAIGAAALVVVMAAAAITAGLGSFSGPRDYRAAPPPPDPAKRFGYYQAGAKAGDPEAQLQLAILYAKGDGVTQDYAAAATWFRAAADQGVARAQYDLGVLYERGRGVQVDLAEAANWYLKAATGRYPLAEYNLAVCYTKGQGIRQDLPEAALWYRRAAGHGVVQAMVNLGMMYEKGEGVAASPVDAYAWFLAAGQRNNEPAAQHAKDLYASLPRLDQIRAEALASDVAASIRNPELERADAAPEKADAKSNPPAR